jgi:hypothetical protein
MALTAAQYKSNFDSVQAKAAALYGSSQERSVTYSQIAAIWSFLYIQQSRFDKKGFTPSEEAMTYRITAEGVLTQAASDVYSGQPQKAMARAQAAKNNAYAYAARVRVDNEVMAVT